MKSADTDDERRLLAELAGLYREADALREGTTCSSSTECCRFGVTGREPYVTSIEILALERAVAARGGPLSVSRRALPLAGNDAAERTCPLLDSSGRCSVYVSRPFGCRTYFCERALPGRVPSRREERALVDRLKALALRHRPDGDAARPLSRVLGR